MDLFDDILILTFQLSIRLQRYFQRGLLLNQACKKSASLRNRKNFFRSGVDFSELKLNLNVMCFTDFKCKNFA